MNVITAIRNCLAHYRAKRKILLLYTLIMLLNMAASVYAVYLFSQIISIIGSGPVGQIVPLAWRLSVVYGSTLLCSSVQFHIRERTEQNVKAEIKAGLLQKALSSHPSALQGMETSRMTEILYSDTGTVSALVFFTIGLTSAVLELIVAAVIIFSIQPAIAGLLAVLLSLCAVFTAKYSKMLRKLYVRKRFESDVHFKLSRDIVKSAGNIIVSDASDFHFQRYSRNLEQLKQLTVHSDIKAWILKLCNTLFEYAWVFFVLLWGIGQILSGTLEMTYLVFFLLYSRKFCQGLLGLLNDYASIQESVISVNRVFDLEHRLSGSGNTVSGTPFPETVESLSLQDVSFSYPEGDKNIIRNFSGTFRPGLALVLGKNGSGKSTLLSLMSGVLFPTSGTVQYNGLPLTSFAPEQLFGSVAYLMQDAPLFDMSIRDNLLSFRKQSEIPEEELRQACSAVGILEDILALPDQFGTRISELRGFSTGQKKKILLARTFLQPSRIVFLDEPLAGIDDASKEKIVSCIERIAERKIVVVSTHMPELFPRSCETVLLQPVF